MSGLASESAPVETAPVAEPVAVEPAAHAQPAETAAAADAAPAEIQPVEAAPAATEGASSAEETAEAAPAAAEDKQESKKPVEPITAGSLRYKAPASFPKNIINQAHALYFWLGDEAAVEAKHFTHFLNNAKTDYARHAVAWSSQTGKGLLYYAKSKDHKDTPSGVLPLSDATSIATKGTTEFVLEIGGHKHVFTTSGHREREGWLAALKPEAEAASVKKEEVHNSEGFKKALEEPKPAVVAASAPKKSGDLERATREESATPKDKSKSRSVSRGKRNIFDRFAGKKEEAKEEQSAAETAAPVAAEAAPTETTETPVAASAEAAPEAPAAAVATEEAKNEETKAEEPKAEEAPKPERRTSKLGDFFKKLSSPTQEKKEADIIPAVPAASTAKETEVPVITEPPAEIEAPTAAETEAPKADEAPVSPIAGATTPTKEKKKFFDVGKIFPKEKAKPPSTETAPVLPAADSSAAAANATSDTEAPKAVETSVPVNGESKASPAEPKDKRRSSFFTGDLAGSIKKLGQKSEKKADAPKVDGAKAESTSDNEGAKAEEPELPKSPELKKDNPLSQLGRRVSSAFRGGRKEANKDNGAPAKVAEAGEASESAVASEAPKLGEPVQEADKTEEAKPEEIPAAPAAIGDVVPEAVNIGTAPPASTTVQATA